MKAAYILNSTTTFPSSAINITAQSSNIPRYFKTNYQNKVANESSFPTTGVYLYAGVFISSTLDTAFG